MVPALRLSWYTKRFVIMNILDIIIWNCVLSLHYPPKYSWSVICCSVYIRWPKDSERVFTVCSYHMFIFYMIFFWSSYTKKNWTANHYRSCMQTEPTHLHDSHPTIVYGIALCYRCLFREEQATHRYTECVLLNCGWTVIKRLQGEEPRTVCAPQAV